MTPTTVTVTMTDEFGNPVAGQAITLAALPKGNSAVITAGDPTTNASGVATFTATDATAEVVTFQATDTTNDVGPLSSEGVVTFGNPPVPPPVAQFCSVVATPTTVPADGATSATISVLLYNGAGDAVPGKTVTLTPSGGNSTVTAVNATTTDAGNALFTVTDTTAESVTYTAEDTTDGVNLPLLPVTVQFTRRVGSDEHHLDDHDDNFAYGSLDYHDDHHRAVVHDHHHVRYGGDDCRRGYFLGR